MLRYFALKKFSRWLKENRYRFCHPPFIANIRREGFDVRFSGVSRHIFGFISKHGCTGIWIHYDGRCWDALSEFDVAPEKSPQGGYFCKYFLKPKFFASRQALLIQHSWEPMLAWVNASFTENTWVCLYGGENDGFTAAKLKQKHEIAQERERDSCFLAAFPVLKLPLEK